MTANHKHILEAVEKVPAFPKSVQQVVSMCSGRDVTPRDVVEVIKHDPIFTLKVLKVVNSPFVGLSKEITSINQAAVYMGINALKNIALSLATVGVLPRKNDAGFDMNEFWRHSMAVAETARKLGRLLGSSPSECEDYFSAGLLHDVGKAVFALYLSKEFKAALAEIEAMPLHEAETLHFGINHAEIGAMLAKKWLLPEILVQAIAKHHIEPPDGRPIVDCVLLANHLCKKMKLGNAGGMAMDDGPAEVLARFNMEEEKVVEALGDVQEDLERSMILLQA